MQWQCVTFRLNDWITNLFDISSSETLQTPICNEKYALPHYCTLSKLQKKSEFKYFVNLNIFISALQFSYLLHNFFFSNAESKIIFQNTLNGHTPNHSDMWILKLWAWEKCAIKQNLCWAALILILKSIFLFSQKIINFTQKNF